MTYGGRVLMAFLGGALFVGGAGAAFQIMIDAHPEGGGHVLALLLAALGFGLVAAALVRDDGRR